MSGNGPERRRHKRAELPCPLMLMNGSDELIARTRCLNICDGGVLVTVPIGSVPAFGSELHVKGSIPRTTPSTYMLEKFTCDARVVRHQPLKDEHLVAVALKFSRPLELNLEV